MADDKNARDDQAQRAERRQREREMEEARARADEPEPIHEAPGERLGDLDEALAAQSYPITTDELVEAVGHYEVETQDGRQSLMEVFGRIGTEQYASADDARRRIQGLIHR